MTKVTLGDIEFDPIDTQDFRLSVEGNSGTGKSNTLAVILEDLADVHLPTLIVERVGALAPARLEDENIVVVGARDEEGIDLAVSLEDLGQIGEWVLDRGMKILVDVSTYADYEADESRVHEAAAVAIRSLNDRAHEKYRSGDRTKSLLVVDEAHWLAPKDSAPEPELDDSVRRCRGQIIKASTEGGNKGISTIVGYQRRAFLHNGVIQLCRDFVSHQPPGEDAGRTADAFRCDVDELANLGTGEILARGETITDGALVGPTKVRKRRSPDPREESFSLPDTPDELSEVLDEIQDEVEEERKRRSEREDELERLREENERLREEKEELEQELADTERLTSALENLQTDNGGAAKDVGEGVERMQVEVAELRDERDELREDIDELREQLEGAKDRNADLEARVAELEAENEDLRETLDEARDVLGVDVVESDVDGDLEQELREARQQVQELKEENEELREQRSPGTRIEPLKDYEEFLKDDVVQSVLEEAKSVDRTSPRYVKGVIASIIDENGPVPYEEIAERLGLSANTEVSKAASVLEEHRIVEKEQRGESIYVDLNVNGLNEVREAADRRQKTEDLMEDL
jgi:cell shape-determining protein MreC